jgi:hypothetical protein
MDAARAADPRVRRSAEYGDVEPGRDERSVLVEASTATWTELARATIANAVSIGRI